MITHVNSVLVGRNAHTGATAIMTNTSAIAASATDVPSTARGQYIVEAIDSKSFRVGIVTGKNTPIYTKANGLKYMPVIKWSNKIVGANVTSATKLTYANSTEDKVTIEFDANSANALANKRLVVRVTYKDLPTRYRKWSESYEVTISNSDDSNAVANAVAAEINRNYKRARITASASTGTVTLTAMPYDDNDTVDSINNHAKVRFSVHMWYTDPKGPGFSAKNKYSVPSATIKKTPGKDYAANAKLVRDAEAQAMGYQGILNHGEGAFPIIKPDMETNLTTKYDAITLQFENEYKAADDIVRKTKQTLQIFDVAATMTKLVTAIQAALTASGASVKTFVAA